ncbi:hypothetical protein EV702DRAFT_970307 [Suillus placidus]|uniref:Uncharacterized protein n=1 Tax=Suillus placidus TaxID=48579 RepID=A0A9P6ZUK9_9AGAM|nr:hypothetical protein EV702DRAFT_970307 [Suillus placidus]
MTPSVLVSPDLMSARYQLSHTGMISATVTEVQAAEFLCNSWTTTNEALCIQWQDQVAEDDRLSAERKHLADEEDEHRQLPLQLEEATTKADERKKNHSKHLAIPMCPRPFTTNDEALVSDFAICRLDKGQYVELYYWTNHGLDDAAVNYSTRDNDSLVPSTGEDGSTVWISSASSKPAAGVIADRNLSPADFNQAIPRIVAAFEDCDWAPERVLMLAQFWGAIVLHHYWNSRDPLAQCTILLFQEEERRAWHSTITSSKGAWDISIINEAALARTFDRVYRGSLVRPDNLASDSQVRTAICDTQPSLTIVSTYVP